jgi:hypothetical protein
MDTATGEAAPFDGRRIAAERFVVLDDQDTLMGLFGPEGTVRENYRIIKHNEHTHIACQGVDATSKIPGCRAAETGKPVKQDYHREFTLFRGAADEALHLANRIHVTPTVVLQGRSECRS